MKLLSTIWLLATAGILLLGCAHFDEPTSLQGVNSGVRIAPEFTWSNHGDRRAPWRNITTRVYNRSANPIDVTVECRFACDGELFGQARAQVNGNDYRTLIVHGMARDGAEPETVTCRLLE